MKPVFVLLFILLLIGCGGMKEPRHKDFSQLEKPPGHESIKPEESSKETGQTADSGTSANNGLYSDVYRVEDKDTEIKIKRTIDDAWMLVGKAILLNKLKITGKNRKEGRYQVAFKTGGLLDGLFGINNASTYLLKLDESNNETVVTISQVEDDSDFDRGMLMDGTANYSYDNSAKLTDLIFDTLHNDVSF